jgi:hypothetical protein
MHILDRDPVLHLKFFTVKSNWLIYVFNAAQVLMEAEKISFSVLEVILRYISSGSWCF